MRKALLPALGAIFAAPTLWFLSDTALASRSLQALAEPPALMEGCGDVPEAVALAENLRDRALRIERYIEVLDHKKAEIADAEALLGIKLTELQRLKDSLRSQRGGQRSAVQTDIDRLVSVYDQMKPAEAAAVLTNLPADFAAEILMRVQPETGARIIASVEPRQAALLTTHMGARSVRQK